MSTIEHNIEIIPFSERYVKYFYDLNIAWLKKYFYVEPHDKEVLENPKSYIIDNGGFIFFAKYNDEIIGTVALMNEKNGYELSKMAVSPKYQGLRIGQKLMSHCIQFAKEKGWEEILLYSHTKLIPAISMYKKNGFTEIPVEANSPYKRTDIKMKLVL